MAPDAPPATEPVAAREPDAPGAPDDDDAPRGGGADVSRDAADGPGGAETTAEPAATPALYDASTVHYEHDDFEEEDSAEVAALRQVVARQRGRRRGTQTDGEARAGKCQDHARRETLRTQSP